MKNKKNSNEISHLLCREIQAPVAASLIKEFAEEIGKDAAFKIAQKAILKDAVLSGKALAETYSDNSLNTMLKIVTEVWAKDNTMTIEHIRLTHKKLSFDVTYCGYVKLYEKLGIKDLGTLLSCCRDFAFLDGFNPDIVLLRTKTIMEGDDICNFCYTLK